MYKPVLRSQKRFVQPTMDQFLKDFFNDEFFKPVKNVTYDRHPAVNILETAEGFRIEFAAPGRNKDNFKISVDKDTLTITAAAPEVENAEGKNYRRREFRYVAFERQFQLPETVDAENIQARYENGILTVELSKKEEAKPQPAKMIEVA
ncbi:MAG: Hsp20/alpha crystallin family protein [Phaeodactylibacter sp.]|nr:Hsp20/alpha crystallin family protein [Phaeodactylibacter sp.]